MIDAVERVIDAVRVLKNGLNVTAEGASSLKSEPTQILAAVAHHALGRLDKAEQQARQRCLAGAALADHRDDRGTLGIDRQGQTGERERTLAAEPAAEALADLHGFDQRRHCIMRNGHHAR